MCTTKSIRLFKYDALMPQIIVFLRVSFCELDSNKYIQSQISKFSCSNDQPHKQMTFNNTQTNTPTEHSNVRNFLFSTHQFTCLYSNPELDIIKSHFCIYITKLVSSAWLKKKILKCINKILQKFVSAIQSVVYF